MYTILQPAETEMVNPVLRILNRIQDFCLFVIVDGGRGCDVVVM